MIDDIGALAGDLGGLLEGAVMGLLVAAFVALTWVKTKSVGAAIVALLAGVAIWAGVRNAELLSKKAEEDIVRGSAAVVQTVQEQGPVW
ncbi:hypothetical protein [Streptomyces alkaliterrae]|uniref:Uncharacterized protein n=1 Tax=Streptomyces alkaliterrae TaxID=2213162 RepID=A0A5P0YP05_9ACTN|nr:hypothetical protein [Streptomyces alkaliterrae]MBB1260163.1 hypothetical protein [Streptomyces alkaliterrae]MQS02094.1 hypothetical protein [Streptomyces alkaliterrae]